ncbi:MAG TPA: 2Fe-2S iron-sulfur cluster-binding protein, partial [Anaerolineae bacterium]|nr:2Fe-2S iron-sulfur cluster-binding protein [Anaerolineae bacterium]
GSTQIQMMGTLGGNVCNGSPASDTVPALVAFGAQLVLAGPNGERIVPVEEFLLGPGQTALRDDELLVAVHLPVYSRAQSAIPIPHSAFRIPQSPIGSAFIKLSRVAADLAKASVAAVVVREGECIAQCRLAFGSVGPTVLRTPRAEQMLIGQPFSAELALEAGRVAAEEISPIDDVRSTAWYRREVVKALTHDVLCKAWERTERQGDKETRRPGDEETRRHGDTETENEGQDLADYASRFTFHVPRFTFHVPRSTEHATRNTKHVPRDAQREIELTVNGVKHRLSVAPNELLLNVLRERLELTGTKYGCGIGECGACTVHLNGQPVLACLVLAIAADGGEVLTVEGLQHADGALDPLQEAFIEHAAFQCGYCTPGMLMMSKGLLSETPAPTEDEIRDYLKGNRCRCTGFASIVRAVMSGAQERGD